MVIGTPDRKTILNQLLGSIRQVEAVCTIHGPDQLWRRIDILEALEADLFHLGLPSPEANRFELEIYQRAAAMQDSFEATNQEEFASIRKEIREGRGAASLDRWLRLAVDSYGRADPEGAGYDRLDEFAVGVLQLDEPEGLQVEPTAEMVFYQPTPARHTFDLLKKANLKAEDVLVDIGSGLGHVPLLASICTEAHCIGIEVEPAYVACARNAARLLHLKNVGFVQQDARTFDFSTGTVFYLYTPFTGAMLRDVLTLLRSQAKRRQIRICTFGPCTQAIAGESWIESGDPIRPDRVALFRSK